jgi:uncharacterized phage protein (TIGR02216 family)
MTPSPQPPSRIGERGLFGERAVELAGFASSLLGWRPGEFWAATPIEFATALGLGGRDSEAMDRAAMDRLLAQFPDNREK